ncbi:leucine-rich repeat-containing protein 43-like [Schistocerca piceifrons]|uniref:leucine-rich repeat-containing protein 43-like n=1 Tax=Schistocerca piceifrons TaxID=274613 RepID=UPI001F5E677B|nr:leucine-rich repeat-containing protein 43-like [Schistocerca piceifrons]
MITDSNLHLLGDCFKQLRTLDLGDNDICVLEDVLTTLRDLKHLRSLRLEGNPCSMCEVYREAVILNAPSLHFLDDIELWNMDRYVPDDLDMRPHLSKGVLLFFCYRLIGLPQPRPMVVSGKKVVQTFHVEVELPLMDPALWQDVPTPPPTPPPERPPSPPPAEGKKGDAGAKGSKKDSKGKKSAGQSDDEAAAETEPPPPDPLDGVEEEPVVCSSSWFRTPDLPWAKLLAYPEPLELPAPAEDLSTLRDTFRSQVRVKVVLQQSLPPEKPKKAKPGKKDAPEEPCRINRKLNTEVEPLDVEQNRKLNESTNACIHEILAQLDAERQQQAPAVMQPP